MIEPKTLFGSLTPDSPAERLAAGPKCGLHSHREAFIPGRIIPSRPIADD